MQARFTFATLVLVVLLFLGMLAALELGRRAALARATKPGGSPKAIGIVAGLVNAVLALLLGFLFAGATTRFDHRRDLVVQELSTISTAWQRLEALPPELRAPVKQDFQRYVDRLVDMHVDPGLPRTDKGEQQVAALTAAQNTLWSRSVAACLSAGGEPARMLLLPSLNEMFDVVDRERLAREMHPPLVIWVMLGVAGFAAALFAGYSLEGGTGRNWLFNLGIAATIAIVTFVIIDIEYPRLGLVRVSEFDRHLVAFQAEMRRSGG